MLIRFSVENYRSFKERQIFSMAAGKHTRHKDHLAVVKGKRLLKAGVLFGANAAGKSNLIKAVNFGKNIILTGITNGAAYNRYFRIDPLAINRPGAFQYDIISNGHTYSYGFAISYTKNIILEEWLYLCDDKDICIFERSEGQGITTELKFQESDNEQRFKIYSEDVPDNKTFLAEIIQHKLKENFDFVHFFNVFEWFRLLIIIFPETKYGMSQQSFVNNTFDSLGNLLKYFDTGIEKVSGEEKSIDDVLSFLPEPVMNNLISDIQNGFDENKNKVRSVEVNINGKRYGFKRNSNGDIVASQLVMNHGNDTDLFELEDESDGTRRLFDLIPLFQKGRENYVILVDELDRSFHTKLTIEYIKKFFEKTEGYETQLIVTLHDSNILDLNILRQDAIWFVERKVDHSSELYSLSKFKQRFDRDVEKDYLLGRYGSIPVFGIENWEEEED